MMTEEQRIEWLLELQDHQLTDAQLQQILDDDEMRQLVQQLGFAIPEATLYAVYRSSYCF